MRLTDAVNPVAYLRELRLLVRELRGGLHPAQLFNVVLTCFLFSLAALIQIPAWVLRIGDDALKHLAVFAVLFMFCFVAFCFWQVSRSQRDVGE